MNYKKIIIYFVLFLIIFLLGISTGFLIAKNKINIEKDEIYSKCWEKARNQLVKTCKPPMNMDKNFKETNFYGKIVKINKDNKQIIIDPAPLSNGKDNISSLILLVDDNTKIEKIVKKSEEEYKKELDEYHQKYITNKNLKYPLQFSNLSANFDDFLVGQKITVSSKEDIHNKEEVGVNKILINYQ